MRIAIPIITMITIAAVMLFAAWAGMTTRELDAAPAQGVLLDIPTNAPLVLTDESPRQATGFGLYSVGDGVVYWAEGEHVGARLERVVINLTPMLAIERPDGSPLACVDLDTGNLVIGPCVGKLDVVPTRRCKL